MDRQLMKYTKRRLQPGLFDNFFRKFSVTNWMILINFFIFILILILTPLLGERILDLAIKPNAFFSGNYWYIGTLLTSMFMHIWLGHLLANMVSLFFIGNFTERIIGRKKFLWLYLASGILAGLFYVSLSFFLGTSPLGAKIFVSPDTPAVGASGAIFALLGLLAVLTPYNKVYLIAGPIIAIITQAIILSVFPSTALTSLLSLFVTIYVVFALFAIFSFNRNLVRLALPLEMPFWLLPIIAIVPLVIIGLFIELPIGNTAHLGGLLAGLAYAYYLKQRYKKKTAFIRRYFAG
jgi:hypothetical protein